MRLSVEAYVQSRSHETSLLEDRGHLFFVGIDHGFVEGDDELVEVRCCLTRLNGISLGSRCIRGRGESLRDRDGGLIAPLHAMNATAVRGTRSRMAKRTRWTL